MCLNKGISTGVCLNEEKLSQTRWEDINIILYVDCGNHIDLLFYNYVAEL